MVSMEDKIVTEVRVGGNFARRARRALGAGALGGRLRRNRIRVVLGDQVTVSVSPYDQLELRSHPPSRGK